MKKILQKITSVFLILCLFNLQGFASVGFLTGESNSNDSEFTSFDEDAFCGEFEEVAELENYLSNNNATYAEVSLAQGELLVNVSSSPMLPLSPSVSDGPPLGIPSFFWGCALSWVGLIIVYVMADDSAETKKALWGCILGTLIWGGGGLLLGGI